MEYNKGSSRYTNFNSAGELWNRFPDEIYQRRQSSETTTPPPPETFYLFLDTMEPESEAILANEDSELMIILPV